ncbi:MAG: hypothetical protein ABI887_13540 [Burkholderiales bacterium]
MTVFRWIMGVLTVVFVGGSALCFVLFMVLDIEAWIERARTMRRGAYLVTLFWFNIEVWGRVVYTLIHW